jgi:hypothetical protein
MRLCVILSILLLLLLAGSAVAQSPARDAHVATPDSALDQGQSPAGDAHIATPDSALDQGQSSWEDLPIWFWTLLGGLVGAAATYIFRRERFMAERLHDTYTEILHPILYAGYEPERPGEDDVDRREIILDLNRALAKTWLYANRGVAKRIDKAVWMLVHPSRQSGVDHFTPVMKKVIFAMRQDIQPWWRCRRRSLKREDIKHFWFALPKSSGSGNGEETPPN